MEMLYTFYQLVEFSGQRVKFECNIIPERETIPNRPDIRYSSMLLLRISEQERLRIRVSSQKQWVISGFVQKDICSAIKMCSRESSTLMRKKNRTSRGHIALGDDRLPQRGPMPSLLELHFLIQEKPRQTRFGWGSICKWWVYYACECLPASWTWLWWWSTCPQRQVGEGEVDGVHRWES